MEEVDSIIIHTLRQIGCENDETVENLKQFSTEFVIEAVVKCLRLIKPDVEISHHLPPNMSARFRLGSLLAQTCVDLGFQGEIGYQTFLYSGESDIRKVFIFLIERLPKETEKIADEHLSATASLDRAISSNIREQLQLPWLPHFCRSVEGRCKNGHWYSEGIRSTKTFHSCNISFPKDLEDLNKKIPKDLQKYYSVHLPLVTAQPSNQKMVLPSVLCYYTNKVSAAQVWENEWNQFGLPARLSEQEYKLKKKQKVCKKIEELINQDLQKDYSSELPSIALSATSISAEKTSADNRLKGSRFTRSEKLQFTNEDDVKKISEDAISLIRQDTTQEEQIKKQETDLAVLKTDLENIILQIESLDIDLKTLNAGIILMEQENSSGDTQKRELEEAYKVKKQTLDLLPNADENMAKLQDVIESSTKRLVILANQWEKHRVPLIEEYRQLKEVNFNKLNETQRKLEEIKIMRERMKELADEARHKDELQRQLHGEYEKTAKDINRAAYTRRILEIVGNIKKQKADIDKVLIDTKEVQKEINQLTGKLDRTFTVTDELVFRDAKKDETVRKAYKYLAALHESCSQLIKTVEETGTIMREIRDLEDQIENESQKKVVANLERIMADYKQMKQENSILVNKLKETGVGN